MAILSAFAFPANAQNANVIDDILFDEAEDSLIRSIRDMNRRQSAIAVNVANATTPKFKPIRFPDEIALALRLYGDTSILEEVNLDDEMVKATKVRLRHNAYVKLLTTKMGITKRIVTMGKGGG